MFNEMLSLDVSSTEGIAEPFCLEHDNENHRI